MPGSVVERMPAKAILIYDGTCPLCLKAVEWVESHSAPGVFHMLACQSEERIASFPDMAEETCMEAMQLALPDGRVLAGEQALPHLFSLMRRWRWLAYFFRVPGVSLLSPFAYGFVAKHRHIISVFVARKHMDPGTSCEGERECPKT